MGFLAERSGGEQTSQSSQQTIISIRFSPLSSHSHLTVLTQFNFLGDKESGKTTLLAKLQGNEDPKKGSGLEFNYIDVRDEDCEEHTLLNLAVLDGDVAHANLLKFALSESVYTDTTVMICTSMATPWAIMDQLNKWIGILQVFYPALQHCSTAGDVNTDLLCPAGPH